MNINKKISLIVVVGIFSISLFFAFHSIESLKRNNNNSLKLFKEQFLELARESFNNSSNLFFSNLDKEIRISDKNDDKAQIILNFINKVDRSSLSVFVFDIDNKIFLEDNNLYGPEEYSFNGNTLYFLINRYIKESILNQQRDFDLDNFQDFYSDNKNEIIPKKIHLHVYYDAGLVVAVSQNFLSTKVRLDSINRNNEIILKNQVYLSVLTFSISFILVVILLIIFIKKVILKPLKKILEAVKIIASGNLSKEVEVASKDEIGQLGMAFNEMRLRLKESYGILESKITERTKELQKERLSLEEKVKERTLDLENLKNNLEKTVENRTKEISEKLDELKKMNNLMIGRELKMVKMKEEIEMLKSKTNS